MTDELKYSRVVFAREIEAASSKAFWRGDIAYSSFTRPNIKL